MVSISEVMTDNVVYVDVDATVEQATRAMRDSDIRHLPVLDQGEVVGILSDRDFRSTGSSGDQGGAKMSVASLMNSDVQSVTQEDDLNDAIDLMIEHRIGAVPVVDVQTQALVGIVSYIDVLKALRDR